MWGAGPSVERDFRASRGAGARQVSLQGHTLTHLHTLTLTHSHTHTLTHSHTHTLIHSHSNSLAHSHTPTPTPTCRAVGARQVSLQGHVRVKLLPSLNAFRKSLVFQVKVLEGVPSSLESGRENRLH